MITEPSLFFSLIRRELASFAWIASPLFCLRPSRHPDQETDAGNYTLQGISCMADERLDQRTGQAIIPHSNGHTAPQLLPERTSWKNLPEILRPPEDRPHIHTQNFTQCLRRLLSILPNGKDHQHRTSVRCMPSHKQARWGQCPLPAISATQAIPVPILFRQINKISARLS